MSTEHDEIRREIGSYLLGALDPADRAAFQIHLQDCPACRDELASYAGLPGLMSRLSVAEVTQPAGPPPPSLLPRMLAAAQAERRHGATRLRRWRVGTAAAVAVAAAAVAGVVFLPDSTNRVATTDAVAAAVQLQVAAGVDASGQVSEQARPWGTALHLTLRLPPAPFYIAWTRDAAGHRSVAGTWGTTRDGRVTVDAATFLTPAQLHILTITTADGTPLLTRTF